MHFPLGKPIAAMILIAVITSGAIVSRKEDPRGDLVAWTFSESHIKMLCGQSARIPDQDSPIARYGRETGKTVVMRLIGNRALDTRLLSLFNDPTQKSDLPDLVFIEIGSVGKFFRPPVDSVGFLPLNDRLKSTGWYDRIVQQRFAPWTKNGVIFGVPIDLHPVGLCYRKDLWDQAGIDLESVRTWREFQQAGMKFQAYWRAHNQPNRAAIALQATGADDLVMMLLQRGVNIIDQENNVHFTDPKVNETLRFYQELTAGENRISTEFTPGMPGVMADFTRGEAGACFAADWFINYLKSYGANLKGKLRIRPLPVFDDTDSPCSTWGGTMAAIPRNARDPEESWKLLQGLLLDEKSWPFHRKSNAILPPIKEAWNDPFYQQDDPFFVDSEPIQKLYVSLAKNLPRRYVTPFTTYATGRLAAVVGESRRFEGKLPEDVAGKLLKEAQADVQRRINFATFEKK